MTNSTNVSVNDAIKMNVFNIDNGSTVQERTVAIDSALEDVEFARDVLKKDRQVIEYAIKLAGVKDEDALFDVEIPQYPFGSDSYIHKAYLILLARVLIRSNGSDTSAAMHARYSSPALFKGTDGTGHLATGTRNVINAKYLNLVNHHGPLAPVGVTGKLRAFFIAAWKRITGKATPVEAIG